MLAAVADTCLYADESGCSIVELMPRIPRMDVPDLPDRIVVATGLRFGVPVISRDAKIQAANVNTIW